ncbi:hypothetical protein GGD89_003807, partial [Roseospira visakhapatnamensis]|nr:hypothetical protein [Roseospira visakhapatnamensis]
RVDDAGHRVIPFQGRDGRFAGVRLLARDGKTQDLAPGRGRLPAEALHVIAPDNTLPESGPVVVAGDHALGVALARATRAPVAVAAEAAALPAAARALRARSPAVRPVLVTTRDGPPMTGAIPQVTVAPGASTGALRDALAEVLEDRAWQVWRAGRSPGPEDRHPLLRVGQLRRGARLDDAGNLLLPLRDAGLRIDGVQVLDPRGRPVRTVTNRPDTPLGHVLGGWVGTRSSSGPLVITDSLDAAVALHRETRATVVQAARGTEALARALRRRFPDRPMLVADDAGAGDTRAVTIARAIGGQLLPLPMTDRQSLRQALTRAGLPPRTRAPARPRTAAPAPSHAPD